MTVYKLYEVCIFFVDTRCSNKYVYLFSICRDFLYQTVPLLQKLQFSIYFNKILGRIVKILNN